MKPVNVQIQNKPVDLSRRTSGVLLHVSSLPGPYGVGDLGPVARQWVEMLADAKQRWWQMLPLGPCGEGHSPYRSFSAFAGNPLLISLEALQVDGLLSIAELRQCRLPAGPVQFEKVTANKIKLLRLAFDRFHATPSHGLTKEYKRFLQSARSWLEDYALFMALRSASPDVRWTNWPKPILRRLPAALKQATENNCEEIEFQSFMQFIFFRQLQSLRDYARSAGVALVGDLPIFVSPESSDVWTHPELFQLDREMRPKVVAGVPPDLFSTTGQCWGNPLYNWREMAKDDFGWWQARIRSALAQADLVRIDHFRGFEAYWEIPAKAPTAETGKWVKAPGRQLFEALLNGNDHLPLVAEDLGIITPEVEALRDQFNLPGMRVLQFGFSGDAGDPHTPHNFIRHCFAYTGTHDNDTTRGWFLSLGKDAKKRLMRYAPRANWKGEPSWELIRILLASSAGHVIMPLQDLLGLGSEARMNTPGKSDGNWAWRVSTLTECRQPLVRLADMCQTYERVTD